MQVRTGVVTAAALLLLSGASAGTAVAAPPAVGVPAGAALTAAALPPGDGTLLGTLQADRNTTWAFGMRMALTGGKAELDTPLLLSADRRDGRGWREVPLPAVAGGSRLNAAATIPASGPGAGSGSGAGSGPGSGADSGADSVRDGWLVGDDVASLGGVLTEHWDGASWHVVTAPLPDKASWGGLLSVSALAADDVWAVGWAQVTDSERPDPGKPGGTIVVDHVEALVEHWDGLAWHRTPVPDPVGLTPVSVAALSPHDVWLAGYSAADQPVVRHFDGRTWSQVPMPATGLYGEIYQLAPDPAGGVWAVGRSVLDPDDGGHALVLRTDAHGRWRQVPVPASAGQLSAVAVTPGGVTAVGTDLAGGDAYAMRLTGPRWHPLPLPATAAAYRYLTGVSVSPAGLTLSGGTRRCAPAVLPQPLVITGR